MPQLRSPRFATHYAIHTRQGVVAIFRDARLAEIYAVLLRGRVTPWLVPADTFTWDAD